MKRDDLVLTRTRRLTVAAACLLIALATVSHATVLAAEYEIHGVVKLDGPRPARKPIPLVDKDGESTDCHQLHQGGLLDENLIVGATGELANAFVYVKKGVPKQSYPVPQTQSVLDQVNCMFRPRVQGVLIGQELLMRNSDTLIHNVRSLSLRNRAFNIAQPAATPDRKRSFRRAEREIRIQCDFHPWMTAYIFVMDHPFFAVTDEAGRFEIAGLPHGEYTLAAWHEELGEQRMELAITNGRSTDVAFSFKPKDGRFQAGPDLGGSTPVIEKTAAAKIAAKKKRRFVRMWKPADFSADLAALENRSIDRGREVFAEASCNKCHLVSGQGNQFGPELTNVAKRFQGVKLVEQVLKPSAEIHKDYQTHLFVTNAGKIITGLLMKEDLEVIQVLPNPLKPDETIEIPVADIDQRKTSQLSTMPEGLLMNFERHEILDLIAFLQVGGDQERRD